MLGGAASSSSEDGQHALQYSVHRRTGTGRARKAKVAALAIGRSDQSDPSTRHERRGQKLRGLHPSLHGFGDGSAGMRGDQLLRLVHAQLRLERLECLAPSLALCREPNGGLRNFRGANAQRLGRLRNRLRRLSERAHHAISADELHARFIGAPALRAENGDATDLAGPSRMGSSARRGVDALHEYHPVALDGLLAKGEAGPLLGGEISRDYRMILPNALVGGGLGRAESVGAQLADRTLEVDGASLLAQVE